jgi:hypothetical protein
VAVVVRAVVLQQPVEAELGSRLGLDPPRQEAADGVAAHQRVEQPDHLDRLPDVLPLDGGQDEVAFLNAADGIGDRDLREVAHAKTLAGQGHPGEGEYEQLCRP